MKNFLVICSIGVLALVIPAKFDHAPRHQDHLYTHDHWAESLRVLMISAGQYNQQQKSGNEVVCNGTASFNVTLHASNLQLYDLLWNLSANASLGPLVQQAALGTVNLVRLNLVSLTKPVQQLAVGFNATGQADASMAFKAIQASLLTVVTTLQATLRNFANLQLAVGVSRVTTAGFNATVVSFTSLVQTFSSQLSEVKVPCVPTPFVSLLPNCTLSTLQYLFGNLTLAVQQTPEAATNVTNALTNPFCGFDGYFSSTSSASSQSSLQVIVDNLRNLVALATENTKISVNSVVSTTTTTSLSVVAAVAGQLELTMNTLRNKVSETRNSVVIALLVPINRIAGQLTTEVTALTAGVTVTVDLFYSRVTNLFTQANQNLSDLYVKFLTQLLVPPSSGSFGGRTGPCANASMNATFMQLQTTTTQFQVCYNQTQTVGRKASLQLTNLASNLNKNLQQFNATVEKTNWNNILGVASSLRSVLSNLPETNLNTRFQQDLNKCTADELKNVEVCVNGVQTTTTLALQRIQTKYNSCLKA